MRIIHAGFRVVDLDESIRLYEDLGFKLRERFEKPDPRAQVALVEDDDGTGLELWMFEQDHPLTEYIGRHIGILSDDVSRDVELMVQSGFEIVIPYTEGVKLNYVFVRDQFGTVFEIAEAKK